MFTQFIFTLPMSLLVAQLKEMPQASSLGKGMNVNFT